MKSPVGASTNPPCPGIISFQTVGFCAWHHLALCPRIFPFSTVDKRTNRCLNAKINAHCETVSAPVEPYCGINCARVAPSHVWMGSILFVIYSLLLVMMF